MDKISWRTLTATLTSLTEPEIQKLLDQEVDKHKRSAFARRLHQRLCTLRAARERDVILKRIKK